MPRIASSLLNEQTKTEIVVEKESLNLSSIQTGSTVVVDENGKLGQLNSTKETKENISKIQSSEFLMNVVPVSYTFKGDPNTVSFGLLAEELAEIYPDLVFHRNGVPYSIQYDELIPFIIHFLQQQNERLSKRDIDWAKSFAEVYSREEELQKKIDKLNSQISSLGERLSETHIDLTDMRLEKSKVKASSVVKNKVSYWSKIKSFFGA